MNLIDTYRKVRARTLALAAPLSPEDMVLQSMPDASPTKWHLAHTTWFFETFVLAPFAPAHEPFDARYEFLFNSYYEAVGPRQPRAERGLSRPSIDDVFAYRRAVDERVLALLQRRSDADIDDRVVLGIHHEEQHQELLLTDIHHALAQNPVKPAYRRIPFELSPAPAPLRFVAYREGLDWIGHAGGAFAFDNEAPRHRVFLESFELASRLSTNGEYLAFIDDGGYRRPELWLSEGFATVAREGWTAPLYWERHEDRRQELTLGGLRDLDLSAPVSHVSFYEADAFARWSGARLPTEAEWEVVARALPVDGNFLESDTLAPIASTAEEGINQLFGDAWEWTSSPYVGYPGYAPATGALGEYNGKFMSNQMVLRGGSCFSPRRHLRSTYRNFFPPHARWQMMGVRLAR